LAILLFLITFVRINQLHTTFMRYCYISRNYKTISSAGGKAKTDIEAIMAKMGFVNLGLRQSNHKNKILDFILTFTGVVTAMFRIRKGDILVLQYPMKKYYETVSNVAHRKGAKVVTQIHDLGSFRRKKLTVEKEINRLNHSDAIIAHNETMKKWLLDNGCKAHVTCLGIFDYLSPAGRNPERSNPYTAKKSICFVGSMSPKNNAFIYDMATNTKETRIILYGNGLHHDRLPSQSTVDYKGFIRDYELMERGEGMFGLSWYGDSLTEGKGKIGEYMSYNNPHKVSLYLRCNMPVILSKTAGLAQFVKDNGIGILVDDISDIDSTLKSISEDDFNKMRENVAKINKQLSDGHYFATAIRKSIELLDTKN